MFVRDNQQISGDKLPNRRKDEEIGALVDGFDGFFGRAIQVSAIATVELGGFFHQTGVVGNMVADVEVVHVDN